MRIIKVNFMKFISNIPLNSQLCSIHKLLSCLLTFLAEATVMLQFWPTFLSFSFLFMALIISLFQKFFIRLIWYFFNSGKSEKLKRSIGVFQFSNRFFIYLLYRRFTMHLIHYRSIWTSSNLCKSCSSLTYFQVSLCSYQIEW